VKEMSSQREHQTKCDSIDREAAANGEYRYKNLTVIVKCEYGNEKQLSDIIHSLVMRELSGGNRQAS
jgi:hypothetical protein